jgi:hypothetical protein
MKYNCNCCNYETDRKSSFDKHNLSQKHLDKSNNAKQQSITVTLESLQSNPKKCTENVISKQTKNECVSCGATFAFKQGLSKHRKTCVKQAITESNNDKEIIASLKEKIKDMEMDKLKMKINFLEEQNKNLSNNNKTLSIVAENNSETSKTSCSALNFVMKNYKNAPCIQEFNDYQLLLEGNEDFTIGEVVIHKFQRDELVSFIGDVLIKKYKTANPGDQSMWSSDAARLAYMIRELTADNEPNWYADKGGVKTANYTVKPILKHIKEDLTRLINESQQTLFNTDYNDLNSSKSDDLRNKILKGTEILQIITKGTLSTNVIKYIASHFFLDRKKNQKKLTYDNEEEIELAE